MRRRRGREVKKQGGSLEEKSRPEADEERWRWKEMSGIWDNEEKRARGLAAEASSSS